MIETLIPASYARAVMVKAGESIELVNLHGTQVVDTWAFNRHDLTEYMSMTHTRSINSRSFPAIGEAFVSTRRRPMLRCVADTSPGVHDTLLCACNAAIYAELGVVGGHRSCEDNLHEALAAEGFSIPITPDPLNLFMNVTLTADRTVVRASPASRPGDSITFRAEMDLIVVMSACPQDITPINSEERRPRDVLVRVKPVSELVSRT